MDLLLTAQNVDEYLESKLVAADPVLELIAQGSAAAGLVPHSVTPRSVCSYISIINQLALS